ncbi:type III secretion system outer membrane ring subunit SctC [Glaciimonas immobilis]|uniref:Type 3 secretion system secretin n=1 Tax=Glaciimonas immobilis TaxID=728004 RepID=A0A840RQP4_9BURK|nr:type III secretion system outer membrane ring subunit SctC [Glaciimonas immobilis]KAF3999327.1 EscC/YscC/HrcC family type III secretion system outer membrane ring protein [Glaciimonas immobilis]MBB5198809.1 type III secretion protein C [Glaciimonas immobilis]
MKEQELRRKLNWLLVAVSMTLHASVFALDVGTLSDAPKYVARQENLRSFLGGVSSHGGKPIIVSKLAAGKQISGEFNLVDKDIVGAVSKQMGLINYYDGHAIYVYDASETKNRIITLKNIGIKEVLHFLKKSGLGDPRYPLRSDGVGIFYVSGPPIYVDLVTQAAEFMDSLVVNQEQQRIEVIKLDNTFVSDRSYTRRDDTIVIPGIATVVNDLLSGQLKDAAPEVQKSTNGLSLPDPTFEDAVPPSSVSRAANVLPAKLSENVRIIAYPQTNSLLVKGTSEQIRFIRNLVVALDEKKRQVELALWIIDLQKDDLDQLGVNWRGALSIGRQFGAQFNQGASDPSIASLEGVQFMASIMALARDNKAQIVSRPVLLTQENTPAMFDNSRTFYTPLVAERAVELQHVTYGTLIHVLPRFTTSDEVELSLNIEDGNEVARSEQESNDALPTVGRTKISTVARVPKGKSLLIGGYTRGESGDQIEKIPFLGDLPFIGSAFRYKQSHNKNTVRVFLIRPREIDDGIVLSGKNLEEEISLDALINSLDKTSEVGGVDQEQHFNGH